MPHLFRTEYSKMVAVLVRLFGFEHVETAEDISSETFLEAMETWPYKGVPQNPAAWLYTVAKNKAKNHINRRNLFTEKVQPEVTRAIEHPDVLELNFSQKNIQDSQLQMLFVVCHPSISLDAQVCLALRLLCGFGLQEIADALLSNKEAIHKKLQRAKAKLKAANLAIQMPEPNELSPSLNGVLQAIYLLFSEGYYSQSNEQVIRMDLCTEAINLAYLLLNDPQTNTHATNALLSLMCFHASRLDARQTEDGQLILYEDQDETKWNTGLIEKGFYYLQQAAKWQTISKYYLEASIAYWHTVKIAVPEKWPSILSLYDALLLIDNTPTIRLNRIFALSKVRGNQQAILELHTLNLINNHFYWRLLAELYKETAPDKTLESLRQSLKLCKTAKEKRMIKSTIDKFKITLIF
jgi:RNA polymerase sigma factor (sigma-70 family)